MKKYILAILTAIILGSCASSTKKEVAKGLNLNDTNSYIVYLKYQTKVEGYQVSVDFSPEQASCMVNAVQNCIWEKLSFILQKKVRHLP